MNGAVLVMAAAGIIAAGASCVTAPAQTRPDRPAAPASASAPADPGEPVLSPAADRILTRLEERRIRDLRAELTWKLEYVLDAPEDAQTKRGEIWFRDDKPVARFLIQFTRKIGGGRADVLDEKHLFDGVWYVEQHADRRQIVRRQVRAESDPADPFKVGEGVFPLPFGQKKADIVREFEVIVKEERCDDDPPETDRLRLIPRAGTSAAQLYRYVDFWIAREGGAADLPVQVRAGKMDGAGRLNSTITIRFDKPRLNEGFSPSVFTLDTPAGFEETVEPLPR